MLKHSHIILIVFFLSSITKIHGINICLNANWSINATTVAGSATGSYGSNASSLNNPKDVFVSNNGSIYVLDSTNYRVQLWLPDATSGITIINSSNGEQLDKFSTMKRIHVDANGTIYILDMFLHRATKWLPGATSGVIAAGGNGRGIGVNQLTNPCGMYVESETSVLWIADSGNNRIVKWLSPTNSTILFGSRGIGADQFNFPAGIFIDESDGMTMYVADTDNNRIQRWLFGATSGSTVAGSPEGTAGNEHYLLSSPWTIVVDANKYMYISEQYNRRIVRWRVGATYGETIAGNSQFGSLPNELKTPAGIAFDSDGSLFVADGINNRIQKFVITCPVTTTSTTSTSSTTTVKSSAVNLTIDILFHQTLFFILFVCLMIPIG